MRFQLPRATQAIKVLPVLAAAMAFSVLTPAAPAGAGWYRDTGVLAPTTGTYTLGQPDLTVSGTSRVFSGDSFSTIYAVTIAVRNNGSASSAQALVLIWDHGNPTWIGFPALAPGGYAVLSYTARRAYPGTDCSIVLTVDPSHLVAESDEYNNSATVNLNPGSPYAC